MTVISLPYYHDRAFIYRGLAQLPGFVLLESSDNKRGDYDILAAYPYEVIESQPSDSALAHLKEKLKPQAYDTDLPFVGGAIGYVSYEWGAELLGVETKPLTIPLMRLQFYDWAIISLHRSQTMVLVARHQIAETAAQIDEIVGWALAQHPTLAQPPMLGQGPTYGSMSFAEYEDAFNAIKQYLTLGRCYQVNLTQRFHAPNSNDAWTMYEALRIKNPVPYSAFMRLAGEDAIISCSPERLLLHDNGILCTSPIKGTIKRSADIDEDERLKQTLLSSEKDRAENVMIVDLLRNDLGKVAETGSVKVDKLCELQSFSTVHHLVSYIQAKLKPNVHPFDAFLAAFPGGSITGAPKKEAMKVIAELETTPRGIYCGSMVYFSSHGRMDSNIAIRTMLCQQGMLTLAAGGGIVMDSELLSEYEECYLKIKAIVDGLQ